MRTKLVRHRLVASLSLAACWASMRPASAESEASTPQGDAGAITFVDAGISSADSGVPPVGPDAGPMGSAVSRGCAIGAAGGIGVSGWSLALGPVALLAGRCRRRSGR